MRRSLELIPNQRQWLENLAKVETSLGNEEEAKRIRDRLAEPPEEARRRRRSRAAASETIDAADPQQAGFTELLSEPSR